VTSEPPLDGSRALERIPWEARGELGLARAFARTLTLSVRQPSRFYALAPRDPSPWPAIAYGLVFEVIVSLASFAYERTLGAEELGDALAPIQSQLEAVRPGTGALLERLHGASSVASLLFAPASYLLELVISAGVTWIGLRLIGALRTSFGTLIRLFAYASWIHLFGLIGVSSDLILMGFGGLVSLGFAAYTWLIVVKRSQGIDTERAVRASLAGSLVAVVAGAIVIVPPALALIAWVLAKTELPEIPR
jgi:hypothetical protein